MIFNRFAAFIARLTSVTLDHLVFVALLLSLTNSEANRTNIKRTFVFHRFTSEPNPPNPWGYCIIPAEAGRLKESEGTLLPGR
jgi:hypothetical protein